MERAWERADAAMQRAEKAREKAEAEKERARAIVEQAKARAEAAKAQASAAKQLANLEKARAKALEDAAKARKDVKVGKVKKQDQKTSDMAPWPQQDHSKKTNHNPGRAYETEEMGWGYTNYYDQVEVIKPQKAKAVKGKVQAINVNEHEQSTALAPWPLVENPPKVAKQARTKKTVTENKSQKLLELPVAAAKKENKENVKPKKNKASAPVPKAPNLMGMQFQMPNGFQMVMQMEMGQLQPTKKGKAQSTATLQSQKKPC